MAGRVIVHRGLGHILTGSARQRTSVVIGNRPLAHRAGGQASLWSRVWAASSSHFCADGGINRLFDVLEKDPSLGGPGAFAPTAVVGDLDSARADVLAEFERHGLHVQRSWDQDRNDLEKALAAVVEYAPETNTIVVFGAMGGRFDQEMASLHAVLHFTTPDRQVVLISDNSLVTVLVPGKHELHLDTAVEGPQCGLFPFTGPAEGVRTEELEWNLDGSTPLCFGQFISSSNRATGAVVTVDTPNAPLLFTTVLAR